jgi:hypothetical protein
MCIGRRRSKPAPAPTPEPTPAPATTPVTAPAVSGPKPNQASAVLSAEAREGGVTDGSTARKRRRGKRDLRINRVEGSDVGGLTTGSGLGLNIPSN